MNDESSRSHLIFSIIIDATNKLTGKRSCGKLSFIDLAGSESSKKTGTDKEGQAEANAINQRIGSSPIPMQGVGVVGAADVCVKAAQCTPAPRNDVGTFARARRDHRRRLRHRRDDGRRLRAQRRSGAHLLAQGHGRSEKAARRPAPISL